MTAAMNARAGVWFVCLVAAAACSHEPADGPHLPPLRGDHQDVIREMNDQVISEHYELEAPSQFRFAVPEEGRVASWHWEPHVDGRPHALGYRHGWCVEYWFTPDYEGYPEQPESYRMAF